MNRMKSFFPKDDELVGFSPNARTKFLIDKGEMEILFDFAENHEFSEEYRIRIEPTHHRRDMANIKIVRWWNDGGVIYYQRPGLLFEDISYLFIERLLINILEAVKEKNLYHFRLIASVGGWIDCFYAMNMFLNLIEMRKDGLVSDMSVMNIYKDPIKEELWMRAYNRTQEFIHGKMIK